MSFDEKWEKGILQTFRRTANQEMFLKWAKLNKVKRKIVQ